MHDLLIERRERLENSYREIAKTHDLETRVEEKLRLKGLLEPIEKELAEMNSKLCIASKNQSFNLDRLPTVKGRFFGREAELQILNDAWAGHDTRVIQFIAVGGTGKTKLIRHWLNQVHPENILAWSFYSQGSSEDKQTSATPFFSHVFDVLHADKRAETDFPSSEAKGEYLAKLISAQRCVLVLDGVVYLIS